MRRQGFQKIKRAKAVVRKVVPQTIVTACPNNPGVPPFDFLWSQCNHAILVLIHVMEIVFIGG
jgi:hypothetical protein